MNTTKQVWFQTTKTGKRQAFFWQHLSMRSIRMGLADAELMVATGQAVDIGGHPLKPKAAVR